MKEIPLPVVKAAWQGFCLDPGELKRILCLCEVYMRSDSVQFHRFIAVAAGLLTKCLTHTMILLCESLTKEPDGGSAAIPVDDFLAMYKFLASVDASADVRYCDGYREGERPTPVSVEEEVATSEHIPSSDKKLREISNAKLASELQITEDTEGMVAGRMMSTTSGEFIAAQIERDIMEHLNEQIAILPDPDLKKKKAKPEEMAMLRKLLEEWLEDSLQYIIPEVKELEEEETPIPDIVYVYAVPGIGPPVDMDTVDEFEEYALDVCKVQADELMPRNIRHYLCPPLEKYQEINYEAGGKVEEVPVPTGGTIIQ